MCARVGRKSQVLNQLVETGWHREYARGAEVEDGYAALVPAGEVRSHPCLWRKCGIGRCSGLGWQASGGDASPRRETTLSDVEIGAADGGWRRLRSSLRLAGERAQLSLRVAATTSPVSVRGQCPDPHLD
jgi:hypothetical protein